MMPTTSNITPFLTIEEKAINIAITTIPPVRAPISEIQVSKSTKPIKPEYEPNMSTATPREAPEETPMTEGPAKGFANAVCIIKPEIERVPPHAIAARAIGKRVCNTIGIQYSFSTPFPVKMSNTALNGIFADPIINNRKNNTAINNNVPIHHKAESLPLSDVCPSILNFPKIT